MVQTADFNNSIKTMLNHLPAEILDNILAQASYFETLYYQRTTFYNVALVCRTLHIPACRWLYRKILFGRNNVFLWDGGNGQLGFNQLLLFLRTVERPAGCETSQHSQHSLPCSYGGFVRHISIDLYLDDGERDEDFKPPDRGRVEQTLERLLKRVPNVQTLIIHAWAERGSMSVNLDNCDRFPRLQDLRITTEGLTFPPWLFQQPGLRTVSVDGDHLIGRIPRMRLPSSLTGLWVSDPIPSGLTVNDTLSYPPGLETFGYLGPTICAYPPCCHSMNAAISFLQPIHSTLRRLELHSCEPPDEDLGPPTVHLHVFSTLESLSLLGKWLTSSHFETTFTWPSTLRELHFQYLSLGFHPTTLREPGCIVAPFIIDAVRKLISLKTTHGLLPNLRLITFTESGSTADSCHILADSALSPGIEDDLRSAQLQMDCYFIAPLCLGHRNQNSLDVRTCCAAFSSKREKSIPNGRIHVSPLGRSWF
ncbi:hypothetical protein FQN54_007916 [Arachnomyces sp. PD_36]|nr:hypothetical protein FQN54_007916 [Arachnomyces sp. PD_36]